MRYQTSLLLANQELFCLLVLSTLKSIYHDHLFGYVQVRFHIFDKCIRYARKK